MQLLSDASERLWNRLITSVDDFGRLEADPEVVFTTCFQRVPRGWTAAKVARCLDELATFQAAGQTPLIQLYQVGPKTYLQIMSAEVHIYRRAKESKYPDPPTPAPICAQVPADSLVSRSSNPELRPTNPDPRPSVLGAMNGRHSRALKLAALEAYTPSEKTRAWARTEFNVEIPDDVVLEFKNYWREQKTLYTDWEATFRNRIRQLVSKGILKPVKKDVWA